ncbi:DUF402 domain-containing protein [Amycolatopsis magusensis]|uniref:DUF402 domain-containing protein n=1 Tax=Amycolatopsis magusensis TaxID=882444 RepID=UPI0024A95FDC|nr:DUF402 domain-containing protein [Amycolatopsis magusensis]MDI5976204.1 DUF402 domain-containing protein [Amycolatopsis magusensis]
MMGFAPGSTVRYRFHRPDGSTGQVHPLRVLADDGTELVGWLPAGTSILGTRLADGRTMREAPLAERFRLPRERYPSTWHGTSNVRRVVDGEWSSVWWFFDEDLRFTGWYVNLEIPLGRTGDGVDRIDGVLDLAVAPDRTWMWKDEDEAEAAVAVGRLTAAQLDRLRAEGERVIRLIEAGSYPFDGTWTAFVPDPTWPRPEL